jgi:hypothetical protein
MHALELNDRTFVAPALAGRVTPTTSKEHEQYVFTPRMQELVTAPEEESFLKVESILKNEGPFARVNLAKRREFRGPVLLPAPSVHAPLFKLLQQWEGTVTQVKAREFTADLRDLTCPQNPVEEATFATEEVSIPDLPLLECGAAFYWSIGYKTSNGQKERVSQIRFRRLPVWTERELVAGRQRAEALKYLFGATR